MKKILALFALVSVLFVAGCSSGGAAGSIETVDPQGFVTAVGQPGVTVIDVRTPAEYAAGHIDGAVNIDVESADFDAQVAKLDKGATYAVYCHSGRRSGIATGKMGDAGFTKVYNLQGGISDLASAGGQVVAS